MRALRPALSREDWQQLNRLLAKGLELPGDARSAWLDALSSEHVHLRTVLTELLTEADAGADETVRASTSVAQLASAALAAMRHERAGDRVGPWRLVELLGTGGMGDVWLAERADGVMERIAALKLPRAEWVDRGLAERIGRERTILARLQHPNIAVLYDAGLTAEGRPYLALEHVRGIPIDAFARERHLDLRERLRLMVHVARAVAYAHSRLVIHRDIKPGNVLVTDEGQPKLLDFGISKLMQGETGAADQTVLTRLAGRALTLAYAAPEQVLGQPVTVATDVYSLGVMTFELAAEARPYRAEDARALEQEILRGDLRRPSDVAPDRRRRTALRGDLDAIVLGALKRAPEERYESASAFADDLERYLAGKPVRARPDSRSYRLRKFLIRNWMPVAAASAVGAALLVGSAIALWQANIAREQAEEAAALNTFVLSLIRKADPHASRETKASDVAMLAAIEQRIDGELKARPQQLLGLRLTVGDAYRNRGEAVAAQRVYQRAADEATPTLAADDLQVLTAYVRAADPQLLVSSAAAQRLDGVIAILRRKGNAGAELLIDALLMRSALKTRYGVPEFPPMARRMEDLDDALAVARSHFGEGSRQHLRVMAPYAAMRTLVGSRDEALPILEAALAAARARADDAASSPEYAEIETERLVTLCRTKRPHPAIPTLWARAEAARRAHGESSPQLELLFNVLAACYEDLNDPTGRWLNGAAFEVAGMRERPPSAQLFRRAQEALGWALVWKDFDAGQRYYESAVENAAAIVDAPLRERLMRPVAMARTCILANRGEADAAERYAAPIVEALNAEFARLNRLTPWQDHLWLCLSLAQRQNGRYAEAIQTAQTFLERCRTTKLAPRICMPQGLVTLALAQLDAGLNAEALATMEERSRILPQGGIGINPDAALARGRVRLANGQAQEAIPHFRVAYGYWLASPDPRGPFAAEAEYWLAQAYLAVGDARGRWMVDEARRTLVTSPLGHHRALAARPRS